MTPDKSLRGKILVVDNDPSIATFMSAVLETSGYGVICADDGDSGLSAARKERPVLICLDANMPHRSGSSLYRAIRSDPDLRRVPVVMVLNSHPNLQRTGRPQKRIPPPDACVSHPLAPHMLLATVNHVLRSRFSIN
jgi:DNA-binding response OmpR family regulator